MDMLSGVENDVTVIQIKYRITNTIDNIDINFTIVGNDETGRDTGLAE